MLQSRTLFVGSQLLCRRFATKVPTCDDVSTLPFSEMPKPGHLQNMAKLAALGSGKFNILDHVCKRHEELGPIYKEAIFYGITDTGVWISDPADSEVMMRQDGKHPIRPPLDPLGQIRTELNFHKGISESDGEEWFKIRSVVNKHFLSNRSIWTYGQEHFQVAKDFVDFIGTQLDANNEVPNFDSAMKRWSLETAGVFSLDTRLGLFQDEINPDSRNLIEAQEMFFQSLNTLMQSLPTWKLYETAAYKDLKESQLRVVKAILKHREAVQNSSSLGKKTQLKSFLDSSDLTNNEKEMVISDFLGGGIETTAYSAMFPLYLLAKNPKKQEILRKEIKENIGNSIYNGKTIARLSYLNAVVREAARIFPFSAFYVRKFDKEIVLSNYRVPPGVCVFNTSNIVNKRDPRYFDDPDQFKPERWLDPDQRKKSLFATVGGFGAGPRRCPGRMFALQGIHCLIAAILARYRLEYHHEPITTKIRLLVVPAQEVKITFLPL